MIFPVVELHTSREITKSLHEGLIDTTLINPLNISEMFKT